MTDIPCKVRFGIIGTNFITEWILRAARLDPRFEASAVYSRTREQAAAFAARHGIPHTFVSLEEMASSPLIDAVYIASPNALHARQAILCMEHGKHVLCEKALASNAREAARMIETARRHGVLLMEAMKPTLTPQFLAVKENLGKLGVIRRYFASYCQYSSRYDRLKAGEVLNAFRPELSNGAVMDIGIYTIYPMVVLFGRPGRIAASGLKLSTGTDGQGAVNFEYPGMNATVIYSKIADSHLPAEIQGENGTITLDSIHSPQQVLLHCRGGERTELAGPGDTNGYLYEIAEFLSLAGRGETQSKINSHENSLITLEIIDEIRRQVGVVFPADGAGPA